MLKDTLFDGLPPPAASIPLPQLPRTRPEALPPGPSILTSASGAKRPPASANSEGGKRVRFKSSEIEASKEQVLGAITKISAHIGNPTKFTKASKLAIQLLQSGSVTTEVSDSFFEILTAAMVSPSLATSSAFRGDYHDLFNAVLERLQCFSVPQQTQIHVWELWAILANEFHTDDTFAFSKAAGRVKQAIDSLPETTEEDYLMDSKSLEVETNSRELVGYDDRVEGASTVNSNALENDPFGLNALLPKLSKREERARRKKDEEVASRKALKDAARLLKERREALLECLRLAADCYRLQWAQTIIDILVKHAFDNLAKFMISQRHAIEQLWSSVREQHVRRKQGKATSGKLDVTAFEQFQSMYARESISIRRAVGSSGDRSAEQWLG